MTKKVFWDDPYLSELDTCITGVDGNTVTLAETIFFAFSGGQESDRGTIGSHPVLKARTEGDGIVYVLEDGRGLKPGDAVRIVIDWPRRYRLMRLHFAAEVILELIYQNYGPVERIGAHIAEDKARIDFAWAGNIKETFPELKAKADAIIESDQPILSAFSDEATGERYWKIEEFSQVPCGGTHLKRTGEIGEIELKRNNIGKGKERVEIYVR